ncbi:MAG: hypothetical protein HY322_09065 [Betaproteobacteria bacterium]|nr:hypothetical protein [Betaproteobacteria bacterium]
MMQRAEIHHVDSHDNFVELAYEQGWTDGLPVFPPTRKLVEAMIAYVGRDPGEVLGTVFPGDGEASIEKIAANCVMAGCRPEYFPVVLAAVECIVDQTLLLNPTQSTGASGVFTLVSGPIVGTLKFHTREWLFGPNGGRANATIGRAIRLVLWNIGHGYPGKLLKGTMGHPATWSYCIGEEQEISPWEPVHVDMGLAATDSAVTVMKAGEQTQLTVPLNTVGFNECITLLARGIGRLGIPTSAGKRGYIFVLNPSLAQAFARAGYNRMQVRAAIAERARRHMYDWQHDRHDDAVPCADPFTAFASERPVFVGRVTPEEIIIVVGGGESAQMGQCVAIASRSSVGQPLVTKKIRSTG